MTDVSWVQDDSLSQRVKLRTTGYVVAGKWISAITLLYALTFRAYKQIEKHCGVILFNASKMRT